MKKKISKCKVYYESWQMQCCGTPLTVGKAADLWCIKRGKRKNFVGIEIDYDEEHHGQGTNCCLRGFVTRIQTIFIDHFAENNKDLRQVDYPDNVFAVIDTNYIDGREICESYGQRKGFDACGYIITLEDVMESTLDDSNYDQGKYILIEPDSDNNNLFWDEESNMVGDTNSITFQTETLKQTIDLTKLDWHPELVKWCNDFQEHIVSGYDVWSNQDWLDWWCRGYSWAKRLKKVLPPKVQLKYGEKEQCRQVLSKNGDSWELNINGCNTTILTELKQKEDDGKYISTCSLILDPEENQKKNYKFMIEHSKHHLFPNDRIMLCASGKPKYQIGTVLNVEETYISVHTEQQLNGNEMYSIELID